MLKGRPCSDTFASALQRMNVYASVSLLCRRRHSIALHVVTISVQMRTLVEPRSAGPPSHLCSYNAEVSSQTTSDDQKRPYPLAYTNTGRLANRMPNLSYQARICSQESPFNGKADLPHISKFGIESLSDSTHRLKRIVPT